MQLSGLRKKLCYKNEMGIYGWILNMPFLIKALLIERFVKDRMST